VRPALVFPGLAAARGRTVARQGIIVQTSISGERKQFTVTTVDVYISRADGTDSLALHNGLFGSATMVLHALIREFQDGAISGPWHSSYIDTTVNGAIVRSILGGISGLDPLYHPPGDWARLAAFQETIDDDADYTIKAIEF
jgi:hypothetical protein